MLFSLSFLVLLLFSHSLQSTAHEKKTQSEHLHRSPLVNHGPTTPPTPIPNINNNPPTSSKATHYLSSTNHSLPSKSQPSDSSSERTNQKEESPPSAQLPIKVLISNSWFQEHTSKHIANSTLVQDEELDLERGSRLVLTHQINLVPGGCGGCEAEFATLKKRLDHLEREVSTLKQNYACAKGAACFPQSDENECPNDCSDQGRCEGGRCVCFPGFNGHDCSTAVCPSDCSNNGQCVNGLCMCDNGYSGLECANKTCPGNCNNQGQCVNRTCVSHPGLMGTDCCTAPSGSFHLRSKDITDSSVTLFWTQPSDQYSTYDITFTSLKDGSETIQARVGGKSLRFTQTGLAAGQKYKVSIRGEHHGKMGPETTTEFITAPSGSVHLQSKNITDSSVTLFWTQPSVQHSTYHITFEIQGGQRDGGGTIQAEVGGRLTSFTQTGLTANQKYKVSIRGERDGKMGPESTTEFMTAPLGSVHLRSKDITDSSVTLFWSQPSVQYRTYHTTFTSLRDGGGTIQTEVGGRLTSFTQTGLTANEKYKVSIRGERDGKMGPETSTDFMTAPHGSIYFQTRDATDSSVTLFWTQPSVQYSTYRITFKSQREGDTIIQSKIEGRLTSFTQTGLAAGQEYKVSIRGERDGKMGPERTTEFTTAPSGSVQLQSKDVTDDSVALFWTQPSVQYSNYHISFTSLNDGDEMITAKVSGRLSIFTQTGLAPSKKYKVTVRGERDGKMGPESTTEFTTAPLGTVHLRSTEITDSSVTLFWTQPSVHYSTYHITFKSWREGETIITSRVGGTALRFTQSGLAAGQKYKVSIRGERDGRMGPESTTEVTTAPSGSINLQTRDTTDSSVTLFWAQPSVQFSMYHITFKSQREGDKIIKGKIEERLSSFTQTGLEASQKYKVSIRGERDGKMGPETTTEFTTAPSGTIHLWSRDITDSSVYLFWTQPSVQYSTYHLTFKSQREGDKLMTIKVGGRTLSFTQTGLAAGQKYKVSIRGERDGRMGPESTTEFTTAPTGSINLQTRDTTDSSVTLFWTQPTVQYSTYHITFKSQRAGDKIIKAKIEGRLSSFTQTGLEASQKYKVSIRGERDGKMGPETTTEFTTAPSGTIHIWSRDITDSSVYLFWTQPSVQYSTYHLTFKSQREGDKLMTIKVGGRTLSFTQTGLAAGQKYKVSIRGERDGRMGPESTTEFTTAPTGSINLQTRDTTDSSVTLFWTQPTVQYSTYHITFKSQRAGDKIIKAKIEGRLSSFTQTGLEAGQKYKVSIRGERDGKMGQETTAEFTTAPSGTVHLRRRDITDSSVSLFWTQPSVQYSTYHLTFKSPREGDKMMTVKVGGRTLSFTQTGLAAGQKYKVSIRGERDGRMGPESTTEFTTTPSGSINLQTRDTTDSSVTLFWTQTSVQYSTYHITFKSQREGDKIIKSKIEGRLSSFTQPGLEAGQKYKVSIRGERDGKMGPETTTEFTTAPSGTVHLWSRDITDSSVSLFWTQPSVQYSTYHLTFKSQREGDKMMTVKVGGRTLSFTQTGLAAGQKYKVSIRGERDGRMGPESTTEFTTAPTGSINLQTRDTTDSSVTLFWTQPTVQYSTYHITFKSQRAGDKIIKAKIGGRLSSFTQTGLEAGQKYKVSIRGERDGKMGQETTTEFTTAPSGTVHLWSRDITDSSVSLFWTQPSVQYSTYHLTFKSQREGDKMMTVKVGGRTLSFTQTGLAAGQKYKVSIRGERDGRMGPESTTEFTTAPTGTINLQTRDTTDSSVTLFWTQPTVQYSTYHITFKSQRAGDKIIEAKIEGRLSSFTQTGLEAGQKYKVSIRGERDGKMGQETTAEFTTAPSGTVHLWSRDITDSSVSLFWTQPSVQYSTYHLTFKSQREGDKLMTVKFGGRTLSFTQTGLAAGQKYKVSIRGERDGRMGPESTTEFTTAPSGSINLQTRDTTDSSVTLFWTQTSVQYSTYHITFKSQREGDKIIKAKIEGRLSSFTQPGLEAGQKYKVSIRGERDGKMGPESTTEFTTGPSGTVHLWSRDRTDSSVSLLWTQPSVQYSTYHLTFKSQSEGDKMMTVKVGGRTLSFTQTGLAAGQKYKVSIRGERDGKMGPESTTEFTTGPSGTVHLWSRDITDSSVSLLWTQPSVQYSTYHLTFKSQREGDKMMTVKVGGRTLSFTQTGLAAGQKYKVSIRGERDGRMGPESTTEFTTAPTGSINLQTRDTTDSSVTLFWTQPTVQYSTYHITFKSQRAGDKIIKAKIEGRLSSFTQTGLEAGQKYKVSIRGERDGKMGQETTAEFTTAPSGTVHLWSRDITDSSVSLFWTQPSVQYSTYHLTFKSQREGDKMMTVKVGGRTLSFTQTGLAAGQKYKVSIRGERDGRMGPESTTEFTTAPSGSINLQTRDTTDSSVTLFWAQPTVQYSTYHIIFKSQREGDKIIKAKIEGRHSSFTQTGLEAGQKYKVSIRGERDGKMGPDRTTEFTTAPFGTVHLRRRDITDSSVSLFWTQPSVQYSNYHIIFKSQKDENKIFGTKVGGRLTSFTQNGLAAGQKYKVSIRGERDGKLGPESTTEFTTAPSGSVHLRSKDITDSSVTLFWTQPSVQYNTYHITFKSQRESDTMITARVGGNTLSFTQSILAAGQKYKVSIRGERDGKMGPESTTEFTTAPPGTVHLQSRDVTDSSVTLFWTRPSVQYSTYQITFKSQTHREGDKMFQATVEGRLTSFIQTGLAAGQKYKVSIRGEGDGEMGPESTTEFTTDISGPRNLHILKTTRTSVLVQWESPMGDIDSYHLSISPSLTETKNRKREGQETNLPSDADAANIDGLEEGRLYYITLIARKGRSQSQPITVQAVPGNSKNVLNKMIVETVITKLQPEGDIITEKKTNKTTLRKTLFVKKNEDVQKKDNKRSSWTGDHSSKTNQDTYKKTDVISSHRTEKTVLGSEAVTLRTARAGGGTGVTAQAGRRVTSQNLLKEDATRGPKEWTKVARPDSRHHSKHHSKVLSNPDLKTPGTESIKIIEGQWEKNGIITPNQTHAVKQRVESSLDVEGTMRTASTVKQGVIKTGGAAKSNQTISEKDNENNAKQVSRMATVTKIVTGQLMQSQSEGRELGTGGMKKNDSTIIRKGALGVQNSFSADWRDRTSKISSIAPFYSSSRSQSRHIHGKIDHNDTSSQTGLKAMIKPLTNHKNTLKMDIAQTDITSSGTTDMKSALYSVKVQNITSKGFILIWEVPQGIFQSFVVTKMEYAPRSDEEEEEESTEEEEQGRSEIGGSQSIVQTNVTDSSEKSGEGKRTHQSLIKSQESTSFSGKNLKKVSQVIPGNARSLIFQNLKPHTRYSLTLFGMSSGVKLKIHHVTITTGPESPSEMLFSNVTYSSLSVSWKKPKSPITGFKVTYTNTKNGESSSVTVYANHSSVSLSNLSPGSSYEVSVVSVLLLKESDPVKGLVITVPDPPRGLRAVNVTDTKAMLVWKPAVAKVDQYIINFGSEKDMTVKVSGNKAEHQLKGLLGGTVYTVTVISQLDSLQSTGTTTTFTTAGGSGIRWDEVPQEMSVSQLTPRTVVLSWKSPHLVVTSYRLTYQRAGQEAKEVTLASTMTKFKLTGLSPSSKYTVQVQGERNGQLINIMSTEFKTGPLLYPFPTDCSQELLNGMQQSGVVEVFPAGRQGRPLQVYCDMETDGGGWTVFQRRMNGMTNFFRGWNDYSYGFGNLSGEFWLGNENIHNLTSLRPMVLRVDLRAAESAYAHYSFFYIDGQRKHYALRVSGYSGTAGDSMRSYSGRPFSTHDKDPVPINTQCAINYRGGWWHKNCQKANINGIYSTGTTHQGVTWTDWKGKESSFPFTEMKLRPASFPSRAHS